MGKKIYPPEEGNEYPHESEMPMHNVDLWIPD